MDLTSQLWVPVIGSLIADELVNMRKSEEHADTELLKSRVWNPDSALSLTEPSANELDTLHLDSMEWMACASRVISFFHIHETGIEDYLLRYKTIGQWAQIVDKSRSLGAQNITFTTSGSTGTPKSIQHDWESLKSEAEFFSQYIQDNFTSPRRFLSVVPAHHIYGFLFSVLVPDMLNVEVSRGFSSQTKILSGRIEKGDVIVGFPAFLRQLADKNMSFPEGVSVINSTGYCDPKVVQKLRAQGAELVLEVYGSSETAGIGYRVEPEQPYDLLPRWNRKTNDRLIDKKREQMFDVQDNLTWVNERLFHVAARKDEAISIKGLNVFPKYVCEKLKLHPQVRDARVRPLNANGEKALKAFIQPHEKLSSTEIDNVIIEVKALVGTHLLSHERPSHYTVASDIPKNEMGKDMDWAIEDAL